MNTGVGRKLREILIQLSSVFIIQHSHAFLLLLSLFCSCGKGAGCSKFRKGLLRQSGTRVRVAVSRHWRTWTCSVLRRESYGGPLAAFPGSGSMWWMDERQFCKLKQERFRLETRRTKWGFAISIFGDFQALGSCLMPSLNLLGEGSWDWQLLKSTPAGAILWFYLWFLFYNRSSWTWSSLPSSLVGQFSFLGQHLNPHI